ncbi:MAG: hypothetical protein LBK06_07785 [Planctomycetaceae bacterium]|nr:hypothetical protein [Planctomycetaceae bacterium]
MLILCIPMPVWAVGFALEQPLHVVALPCSALRILKRLQHNYWAVWIGLICGVNVAVQFC